VEISKFAFILNKQEIDTTQSITVYHQQYGLVTCKKPSPV